MKVLLITPAYPEVGAHWMPLGICYIAAALVRKGHEVKVFDRYVTTVRYGGQAVNGKMLAEINEFAPDLIGFNTITPVIYDTVEAIKLAREVFTNPIVLGGHHATAFPELTLARIPEADGVIKGEAEESLTMLAGNFPKSTIPGLYWRDGISGSDGRASISNLDSLPFPAYQLLDMDYYTEPNAGTVRQFYLRTGSILASRGCKNRCVYCTESLTYSGGVRYHSADYVVENLGILFKIHNCNGATFLDNDFLADRGHAEAILEKIIAKRLNQHLKFCIQSRVTDIDMGIARLLRAAGCVKVELGLESNEADILNKINKNATVDQAEKAIKICRANQLSVQANLIMGFEGETLATLDKTLSWLKGLGVDNFKWVELAILPGSQLYLDKGNRFFETEEWSREKVESYFRETNLSELTPSERNKWVNSRIKPYSRYLNCKGILNYNTLGNCFRHYYKALLRKVKG